MKDRFLAERKRLGFASGYALAQAIGVSHTSIKRIEEGVNIPGGELLAAFAGAGADVGFIVTGNRSGLIDLQLLGVCEAALRAAYGSVRAGALRPIRPRITASLYNMIVGKISPDGDETSLAMTYASQMLATLDDPGDPELLERNLFVATAEQGVATVNVTGNRNRVAGRNMIGGGKGKA